MVAIATDEYSTVSKVASFSPPRLSRIRLLLHQCVYGSGPYFILDDLSTHSDTGEPCISGVLW